VGEYLDVQIGTRHWVYVVSYKGAGFKQWYWRCVFRKRLTGRESKWEEVDG
jgi:hypothetical protein